MAKITNSELVDTFNWRYATKAFDPSKTISDEDWSTLKEALRLTPSSFGLQPWHFFAITGKELREQLLPHTWGQTQVTDCSHYLVISTCTNVDEAYIAKFIASTAEIRGVSVESLEGYQGFITDFVNKLSVEERLSWSSRQAYLALQRVMDTAALLEIDACPIEGFLPDQYNQILQLPEKNLNATVCCALGYRSSEDKYAVAAKSRFPLEQIFTEL